MGEGLASVANVLGLITKGSLSLEWRRDTEERQTAPCVSSLDGEKGSPYIGSRSSKK